MRINNSVQKTIFTIICIGLLLGSCGKSEPEREAPADIQESTAAETIAAQPDTSTIENSDTETENADPVSDTEIPDKETENTLPASADEIPAEGTDSISDDTQVEPQHPDTQSEETIAASGKYKDGTYEDRALGFNANVTVSVIVSGDVIENITVLSHAEDDPYWTNCQKIIERIVSDNSADVDAVAGATFTSEGIINAVKNALTQAEQ